MRRLTMVAVTVLVAGCGGSRVGPLRSGSIAMNSEVSGTLARSDARLTDGSVYQAWTFFGTQGQMVQVDVMSDAFDAFCILQGPAGNEIARDDDAGDGLNARINVAIPVTGTYRIIANTYRQNQFGRYRVRLTGGGAAPMAVAPQVTPMAVQPQVTALVPVSITVVGTIAAGQQASGVLSMGDARYDGKPYQAYNFGCAAGQTFQMDVMSSWDNYALVFDPMGNVVARDDDTGEGLNARIMYTCLVTGTYRLAVTVYATQTVPGAYTMQVH